MMENGRKTIAVFVSQATSEYQSTLCKGIIAKGRELDYNILFFTNFGGYGQTRYDSGELSIANLPYYQDFDGIILAYDTFAVEGLADCILQNVNKYAKCPVVTVRRSINNFYNILIDDDVVIEEIVTHLIKVHKYKRINFLAGPKGYPDSEKRLQCFLRIMKENHLEVREDQIYYGDLWKKSGEDAVKYFLMAKERPEAIVCANDYMAITVCNALMDRGIRVPEDIAVTGCDDIDDASEYSPSLTTVKSPTILMGEEAILKLDRCIQGKEYEQSTFIKTETMIRESCGCKLERYANRKEMRRKHIEIIDQLKNFNTANAYMSTDFTGEMDFNTVLHKVDIYVFENKGFHEFFLFLCDDWDNYDNDLNCSKFSERVHMKIGRSHTESFEECEMERRELLPSQYLSDEPAVFFFAPLHHLENVFGYVAISFNDARAYSQIFQGWLINVSNALENLKMHGEVNRLLAELKDMYIRDALTGLYNRRGLEMLSDKLLERCIEEKKSLMVLCADMDDLKIINDKHGHAYGDIAIKSIGNALLMNACEGGICTRCGGDEFTYIGMDYNQENAEAFVLKVQKDIDEYIESRNINFHVSISYGYYIILPDHETSIEECMNIADSYMYQQKYKKKALSYQGIR